MNYDTVQSIYYNIYGENSWEDQKLKSANYNYLLQVQYFPVLNQLKSVTFWQTPRRRIPYKKN